MRRVRHFLASSDTGRKQSWGREASDDVVVASSFWAGPRGWEEGSWCKSSATTTTTPTLHWCTLLTAMGGAARRRCLRASVTTATAFHAFTSFTASPGGRPSVSDVTAAERLRHPRNIPQWRAATCSCFFLNLPAILLADFPPSCVICTLCHNRCLTRYEQVCTLGWR